MKIYPHWHMTVYWGGDYSRMQIYYGDEIRVRTAGTALERHYQFCDDKECWFSKFPKENA